MILLLFSVTLQAQDYTRVDAIIKLYPETVNTPQELSKFISRDFQTDDEKVRAIYSWLIHNISYDPKAYKIFNYQFKNYAERNKKEAKTRKKIIEYTLQSGKAVCEGYAMTFEKLLQLQGIENYLVRGDTKTHFKDIGRKFNLNHLWNVITIKGKKYLFDATWGAGKYNKKFIKEPSYYYYKTPPELLIKTHYPAQFEDAFIEEKITKTDFFNRPVYIDPTLNLKEYSTATNGIIKTTQKSGKLDFGIGIQPEKVAYAYDGKLVEVEAIETYGNGAYFNIPIQLGAKTLLIYINEKPVLGYIVK